VGQVAKLQSEYIDAYGAFLMVAQIAVAPTDSGLVTVRTNVTDFPP
jgi:hypothetical protein